jgi:large subunit ribosomal protein L2
MPLTIYKPTTNGRRGMMSEDNAAITTKKPVKSLTSNYKRHQGRNNQGRITTRHKGGGQKKLYRKVSFTLANNFSATVEHIEYDPNRTANIARVKDNNNKYHYILATNNMKIGQIISCGDEVPIDNGNRLKLKFIPIGSTIHAIELQPNRGAQLVRSAGNQAQLIARDESIAQVKLPSGEIRAISVECQASIGVVGNEQHQNVSLGKAGVKRHKGIRPTVRGVVMNAVDHPHGGGDGGRHRMAKAPRTPWGQKTLGYKTRHNKSTDKYIIRSRHLGKRK